MNKINLIDTESENEKSFRISKKKFILYPIIFIGVFFFLFFQNALFSQDSIVNYFVSSFKPFQANEEKEPIVTEDKRINVLLMGIGGLNHAGGTLTDTMMVLSIHEETNTASMISIPRDLYVEIPDYGWQKINHAYALTERDSPGSGGAVAISTVENVLGIEIPYYVTVDFKGFEEFIDDIGGVELMVENGFIDSKYPAPNYLYQTIEFKKGYQSMDGKKALQYARSRHGICTTACEMAEGSDFARSKRQQKLIQAVKEKVLSANTLGSPKKIFNLYNTYKKNIDTNVEIWDALSFYTIASELKTKNISQLVIDNSPDGFLRAATINGQYVLQPKTNSFDEIQKAVQDLFSPANTHTIAQEKQAYIEIQNGTKITGLASRFSKTLQDKNFLISKIGNADVQNYTQTRIYDFTDGTRPDELKVLTEIFPDAKIAIMQKDEIIDKSNTITIKAASSDVDSNADFLVILGSDIGS